MKKRSITVSKDGQHSGLHINCTELDLGTEVSEAIELALIPILQSYPSIEIRVYSDVLNQGTAEINHP